MKWKTAQNLRASTSALSVINGTTLWLGTLSDLGHLPETLRVEEILKVKMITFMLGTTV